MSVFAPQVGSTSIIRNETPGGLVNGANTAYTTASTFATGSLKVYLNGQRLAPGSGIDFVEGVQAFTMQYAPATGDVLVVDYETTNSAYIVGTNSQIVQETPTGTVNGATTLFTTLQAKYVANSLEVFLNGVAQIKTTDYAETSPGAGTFTFTTAPVTGDVVRVNYQFSTGSSGNSDTVDGVHASAVGGTPAVLVADDGGWVLFPGTLLFASATTITTPVDYTSFISVSDKLRLKQGAGYLYFYITAVTATTLTITGGSDYTLANATITSAYYSKQASPVSFPQWFNYTPTIAGFSVAPTAIPRFNINGRLVTLRHRQTGLGTSNATTFTTTAPVTSANITGMIWGVTSDNTIDNSAQVTTPGTATIGVATTTITLSKTAGTAASWTAAGGKGLDFTLVYEI
ncbi:MAG: hypothetical protein QFB87_04550 [Patescibacteria group bacterium]|nr:hypothetical protein [Patescibacteria group bacterium]